MEITYHITADDYLQFNLFHLKHSQTAVRSLNQQRFIGPIIFLIFSFVFSKISGEPFLGLFITFLILSILWILFYPKYYYSIVKRRVKKMLSEGKNAGVVGEHHLVIADEGLTETSAFGEMKVNWAGIQEIRETPDFFYLYNSSVSAFIIPKRDLVNVEEFRSSLHAK